MHTTDASKKRRSLRLEAMKLEKEVKALAKVGQMEPAARTRQDEADRLKAEAEALKDKARLEDLHLWQMNRTKRTTAKDTRTYTYWMASWREGNSVRNVHLGSVKNIDAETARQKARKIKAESLGLTGSSAGAEPG
ncbi:Uncharacterised protein [uncultured archaeon]|nr:Uncharacterised protein [uncultured archaeon]